MTYMLLLAGGLVMVAPFLWMVVTSLKTRAEVFGSAPLELPTGIHLENYAHDVDRAAVRGASTATRSSSRSLVTVGQVALAARWRHSRSRC